IVRAGGPGGAETAKLPIAPGALLGEPLADDPALDKASEQDHVASGGQSESPSDDDVRGKQQGNPEPCCSIGGDSSWWGNAEPAAGEPRHGFDQPPVPRAGPGRPEGGPRRCYTGPPSPAV